MCIFTGLCWWGCSYFRPYSAATEISSIFVQDLRQNPGMFSLSGFQNSAFAVEYVFLKHNYKGLVYNARGCYTPLNSCLTASVLTGEPVEASARKRSWEWGHRQIVLSHALSEPKAFGCSANQVPEGHPDRKRSCIHFYIKVITLISFHWERFYLAGSQDPHWHELPTQAC